MFLSNASSQSQVEFLGPIHAPNGELLEPIMFVFDLNLGFTWQAVNSIKTKGEKLL